jgi:formylglycine-generating enzyme required for sulfatase activity
MGRLTLRTAAAAVLLAVPAIAPRAQQQALLDMVPVPGGTFRMGDTFGDGRSDERPLHSVTVSGFALSRYEVTVGQFRRFVQETGYLTSAERQGGWLVWTGRIWERKFNASWKNPYFAQTERDPVVMVSWDDAVEFCTWLSRRERLTPFYAVGRSVTENRSADGYRLPTEAEWEYAARSGGEDLKYSWGNGGPEGNVADETLREAYPAWPFATWPGYADGHVFTAPVGSYPPNARGLYDMSGNVWEWCNDWYGSYAADGAVNPVGPGSGVTRCLRGGSWTDEPAALRATFRSGRLQNGRGVNSGFRPARSRL